MTKSCTRKDNISVKNVTYEEWLKGIQNKLYFSENIILLL